MLVVVVKCSSKGLDLSSVGDVLGSEDHICDSKYAKYDQARHIVDTVACCPEIFLPYHFGHHLYYCLYQLHPFHIVVMNPKLLEPSVPQLGLFTPDFSAFLVMMVDSAADASVLEVESDSASVSPISSKLRWGFVEGELILELQGAYRKQDAFLLAPEVVFIELIGEWNEPIFETTLIP
ncbi:hypothetical protein PIB30_098544 [Stylosanthes scabra]|uniref:Uncharacterized protein n=1 Tax=Stylosanthes scabra TaxID=79078 RepID=A0ABU6WWI7_9FABA|nr:hypothetical protein [Stylosanthes scabra]